MKRAAKKKTRGPAKGHPGWGGRPKGPTMPCGWGCGSHLTATQMRPHFAACPCRPLSEAAAKFGALVRHVSTVRPRTVIAVERDSRGEHWVRVRTADVVTWERNRRSEIAARAEFERVVERHEKGEPLDGN